MSTQKAALYGDLSLYTERTQMSALGVHRSGIGMPLLPVEPR